jgi:Immunoglobulin I-set domain
LTVEIPLPTITTNPVNQNVFTGQTVTFTAAANGTPTPKIQWQVNRNDGFGFVNIGGAISPTYRFTAAQSENGFEYDALFTNSFGGAATTAAATLVVATSPVITVNPTNQSGVRDRV